MKTQRGLPEDLLSACAVDPQERLLAFSGSGDLSPGPGWRIPGLIQEAADSHN